MGASWSFGEVFLLFLIGLIVLGPERLPRVANQLGTLIGKAKRMTRVMKRQLEEELDVEKNLGFDPKSLVDTPNDDDAYSPMHEPEVESIAKAASDTLDVDTEKPREQQGNS
ncbi:MAG: twin-arginine translocase TatA/TatE family subunit [Pseudomonadota bacterium]